MCVVRWCIIKEHGYAAVGDAGLKELFRWVPVGHRYIVMAYIPVGHRLLDGYG